MAETTFKLTTEEILQLFDEQLPTLLEEHPELEPRIYHAFLKVFVRREEFVALHKELTEFRAETRANFERVDRRLDRGEDRLDRVEVRLDRVEHRLETFQEETRENFKQVHRSITSLGGRWGIYTEDMIRRLIGSLLEETYGVRVERKVIDGEEFDLVITDGEHILVEITARAKSDIQRRLERKRELYIEKVGQAPNRIILGVGSIYSSRAQALREAGFEVIEPGEDLEAWLDKYG